jgi:hypothetical protein
LQATVLVFLFGTGGGGAPGSLNHLGVEVDSTDEVLAASRRMQAEGAACDLQESTTCCYAVQDKVWVSGPEIPWEIYTVLADAPVMQPEAGECCAPDDADASIGEPAGSSCC